MNIIPALCRTLCALGFSLFFIAAVQAEVTHTVKAGESLSTIAKKFHVYIDELKEANGLEGSKLVPGQTLSIPVRVSKPESRSPKKKAKRKETGEDASWETEDPDSHVVRPGDTLGKMARQHHLSIEELRAINQLKGNKLKTGQVLYLRPMEEGDEEVEGETQSADGQSPEDGLDSSSSVEKGGVFAEVKDPELLARTAKIFLGAKYRKGGSTINGLDCSAYVQKVFWVLGIELPRTAREQFQLGMGVAREALRAGDLLFFKRSRARHPTHVGIYIGNDQFIHTSLSKRRVQIDTLDSRYFRLRFLGAKRIIEQKNSGTPANVG